MHQFFVEFVHSEGLADIIIHASFQTLFTVSLHGARNFPARKQESDLDVPLPDGCEDGAYLEALDGALAQALERARPEVLLVQAGVDVLAQDRLGRLALSPEGVMERDRRILSLGRDLGIPTVTTLGGGYGEPIEASIAAHVGTWRVARELFGG